MQVAVIVLALVACAVAAPTYDNKYPSSSYNNKGYDGYENKGYGGYDNKGYGGYENKGYGGYDNKGYGGYQKEEYAPAYYNYDYAVKDDYSYVNFGANEYRNGDNTKGSYHVQLPDGRVQTVSYYVDGYSGYVADVKYDGEAKYGSDYNAKSYAPSPKYPMKSYDSYAPKMSYDSYAPKNNYDSYAPKNNYDSYERKNNYDSRPKY